MIEMGVNIRQQHFRRAQRYQNGDSIANVISDSARENLATEA